MANVVSYALSTDGLQIHRDVLQNWGLSHNNFGPLRMLTSMFLHANPEHLIGNMWFLYIFGFAVEGRLRTPKYLLLYFLAGGAGDLLHESILGQLHPNMPSIGASGAIMGVVGAALYLFPFAKVSVLWGWGYRYSVSDWPMWGIGLYYLGFDLLLALLAGADGVGHFAHIGGAAAGCLLALLSRAKRDSAEASEAKAMFAESKDLGVLSKTELAELHRVNPTDPLIVLHWIDRSLRDPLGVSQECSDAFFRLLPRIMNETDIRTVGQVLIGLTRYPGLVKTRELMTVASRLEGMGERALANQMYEQTLRQPDLSDDDRLSATFRLGILSETAFANPERACQCYLAVVQNWPMSPFADQARMRLQGLGQSVS